ALPHHRLLRSSQMATMKIMRNNPIRNNLRRQLAIIKRHNKLKLRFNTRKLARRVTVTAINNKRLTNHRLVKISDNNRLTLAVLLNILSQSVEGFIVDHRKQ